MVGASCCNNVWYNMKIKGNKSTLFRAKRNTRLCWKDFTSLCVNACNLQSPIWFKGGRDGCQLKTLQCSSQLWLRRKRSFKPSKPIVLYRGPLSRVARNQYWPVIAKNITSTKCDENTTVVLEHKEWIAPGRQQKLIEYIFECHPLVRYAHI